MLLILIIALFTCMHGIATGADGVYGDESTARVCAFWTVVIVVETSSDCIYNGDSPA